MQLTDVADGLFQGLLGLPVFVDQLLDTWGQRGALKVAHVSAKRGRILLDAQCGRQGHRVALLALGVPGAAVGGQPARALRQTIAPPTATRVP